MTDGSALCIGTPAPLCWLSTHPTTPLLRTPLSCFVSLFRGKVPLSLSLLFRDKVYVHDGGGGGWKVVVAEPLPLIITPVLWMRVLLFCCSCTAH